MESSLPLAMDHGPSRIVRVNAEAEVHHEGQLCALIVLGIPLLHWTDGDVAAEAYATVLLVQDEIAYATEVAEAFGVWPSTIHRALKRFREGGLAGLVPRKCGRKGPLVIRDLQARQMLALKNAGVSNMAIAARLGVTEGGIRAALHRVGYTPPSTGQTDWIKTHAQIETAPVETAPIETARVEAAPVEPTPVETVPVETAPSRDDLESVPVQADPVESDPIESDPVEAGPVEASLVEAGGQQGALTHVDPWDRSMVTVQGGWKADHSAGLHFLIDSAAKV